MDRSPKYLFIDRHQYPHSLSSSYSHAKLLERGVLGVPRTTRLSPGHTQCEARPFPASWLRNRMLCLGEAWKHLWVGSNGHYLLASEGVNESTGSELRKLRRVSIWQQMLQICQRCEDHSSKPAMLNKYLVSALCQEERQELQRPHE